MAKRWFIWLVIALIGLLYASPLYAAGMEEHMARTYGEGGRFLGMEVKNQAGEELGTLRYLIKGPEGDIVLAVISHGDFLGIGGKQVAVPYTALSYDRERHHLVMDISREQLAYVPDIDNMESLTDRSYAEDVYRFFGERPYWAENSSPAGGLYIEG